MIIVSRVVYWKTQLAEKPVQADADVIRIVIPVSNQGEHPGMLASPSGPHAGRLCCALGFGTIQRSESSNRSHILQKISPRESVCLLHGFRMAFGRLLRSSFASSVRSQAPLMLDLGPRRHLALAGAKKFALSL
jgi:hypothetical protein